MSTPRKRVAARDGQADDRPPPDDDSPVVAPSAPVTPARLTSEGTGDAEFMGVRYHTVQRKGD